jgi:hypothetical protein
MLNGWTKWLVGALWTVVCGVILFTGNVVKANDGKNTLDHTAIRKEIVEGDAKINEKIDKKFEEINNKQTVMLVQQAQMSVLLEKIEKKME